jgi:hypothetical protein
MADPTAQLRRHASDVPKPSCPWCGASTSAVYRSKPILATDAYRRRRQCDECRETWPTVETLDEPAFDRELAARGLTRADLSRRHTRRSTDQLLLEFGGEDAGLTSLGSSVTPA